VQLQPAEVPVSGAIEFHGTELSDKETRLLIQHGEWREPLEVDSVLWGVSASETLVVAGVQAFVGSQPVLPGIYSGMLKVITERTLPDGSIRRFEKTSNQAPFAVTPRIDAVNFAAGLGTVTGYNFDPDLLPGDDIQLYLGTDRLERVTVGPGSGQFRVVDRGKLEFAAPAAAVSGAVLPLRLIIRGAESAPRWITLP
jgi:hypothetical protein